MRKLMITLMLIFTGTNLAYASHTNDNEGYGNIAQAAHALENSAKHFHQQVKYDAGRDDHATRDAKKFAQAARHFHRQIERGSSYGHIRGDYTELVSAYAHARQEFGGRHDLHHDRHSRGDFREVQRAFDDLNRAIQYAQSGYSRNWDRDRHYKGRDGDRPYGRGYGRYDSGLRTTFKNAFGS